MSSSTETENNVVVFPNPGKPVRATRSVKEMFRCAMRTAEAEGWNQVMILGCSKRTSVAITHTKMSDQQSLGMLGEAVKTINNDVY